MKDRKGQALVEFIIIMPIFLLMIMSMIDLGNILYKKYSLENELDYIVDLYRENKIDVINAYSNNEGFTINITNNNQMTTIEIKKEVNIYTPFLSSIMTNPYRITVDRVIYSE